MSAAPKGYPTQKKDDLVVGAQFSTVQPLDQDKYGLDVHSSAHVRLIGSDAVEASSTATQINATAHAALVGDLIRMTSGATSGQRVRVIKIDTNIIYISALSAAPSAADTFEILRHTAPLVDADGKQEVNATLTAAPVQFVLNGVDTEVEEDTGTPADSRPLPVKVLDSSGVEIDFATQTTLAALNAKVTAVDTDDVTITGALPAGTNNIGDVDVVSSVLPTGAATSANQTSEIALLTTIDADTNDISVNTGAINNKLPVSLGQKTSANSLAVVIASDQSAVPVSATNLDIRDLTSASDSVAAVQSGTWTVNVNATLSVVDFIDTTPVLDTSSTNIPASASTPLTIVASLAAAVKKVQLLDTTGEFIGLYSDPAGTPVLLGVFGPGSDQTLEITIPATTVIGLRNMANTAISSGSVAINFIG